ncbi:MAG: DUF4149 domain-containing protein [Thermodesulfobacteriota bacterium]|nr:MAG: DUF4149 domain-containing protein [Thermodesulfobacteriota bacterium]
MTVVGIAKFIHLLSIVVWLGALVFFSFFAAPSIFKVLPREEAGTVVGAIFPKYWAIGYVSSSLAIIALLVVSYIEKSFPAIRLLLLAAMTVITFYSGLTVGARARTLKADIKATEDTEKKALFRKEFKKVHFVSSVLNMTVIAGGVVLIFFTSQALKP